MVRLCSNASDRFVKGKGLYLKIGAYVLAADATWIVKSVSAYYGFVDVLVVSYDSDSKSWTGIDIPVHDCCELVKKLDVDSKIVEITGNYSTYQGTPMERDTKQRQDCIDYLSGKVDWIIQLDTDEWIPKVTDLIDTLDGIPNDVCGVEWPMRVLYRHLRGSNYLGISDRLGNPVYEYPGPVLVRKNVTLVDARRISERVVRYAVAGDTSSIQLRREHTVGIEIRPELGPESAIIHNSWARSPRSVWKKVTSWSHSNGMKSWLYFFCVWLPSSVTWRLLLDIHPFARGLWPKLSQVVVESSEK
jgi:hypothetical protein